jgi:hypothetical protein
MFSGFEWWMVLNDFSVVRHRLGALLLLHSLNGIHGYKLLRRDHHGGDGGWPPPAAPAIAATDNGMDKSGKIPTGAERDTSISNSQAGLGWSSQSQSPVEFYQLFTNFYVTNTHLYLHCSHMD